MHYGTSGILISQVFILANTVFPQISAAALLIFVILGAALIRGRRLKEGALFRCGAYWRAALFGGNTGS